MKSKLINIFTVTVIILNLIIIVYISYFEFLGICTLSEKVVVPLVSMYNNNSNTFNIYLNDDDITNIIKSNAEFYEDNFQLRSVEFNHDSTLSVVFNLKDNNNNDKLECFFLVYENICQMFFYDGSDEYRNCQIDVGFINIGEYFNIKGISYNSLNYEISTNMNEASIIDIADFFPNASSLHLCNEIYNIEEISSFKNLKSINFPRKSLTDYEREYIYSLFPDCEIHCGYILN